MMAAVDAASRLMVAATGLAACVVLVPSGQAAACSCVLTSAQSALGAGEVAFVGAPVDRREEPLGANDSDPIVWTFEVDEVLKGEVDDDVVEIRSGLGGGDCGYHFEIGRRYGLVPYRQGDRWSAGICGQVWEPSELRSVRPLPAPSVSGRVAAIVSGRLGEAAFIALDARGRVLAQAAGPAGTETQRMALCPGGRAFVGIDGHSPQRSLTVRGVADLGVRSQLELPSGDAWLDVENLQCAARSGRRVFAFLRGHPQDEGDRSAVAVLVDGSVTAYDVGIARDAVADEVAEVAYFLTGTAGDTIKTIDLDTGEVAGLVALPAGYGGAVMRLSPDGSTLAVLAAAEPGGWEPWNRVADTLLLVDLAGDRSVDIRPLGRGGNARQLAWVDGHRLLVTWELFDHSEIELLHLDGTARPLLTEGWIPFPAAVVGGALLAAGGNEDRPAGVVRSQVDGSGADVLLADMLPAWSVLAVPDGPRAAPVPLDQQTASAAPTTTVASTTSRPATTTPPTTTSVAPTSIAGPSTGDAAGAGTPSGGDGGSGWVFVVAVVVAAGVVALLLVVVRRRRIVRTA